MHHKHKIIGDYFLANHYGNLIHGASHFWHCSSREMCHIFMSSMVVMWYTCMQKQLCMKTAT